MSNPGIFDLEDLICDIKLLSTRLYRATNEVRRMQPDELAAIAKHLAGWADTLEAWEAAAKEMHEQKDKFKNVVFLRGNPRLVVTDFGGGDAK